MTTQPKITEIVARALCGHRGLDPEGQTADGRLNFECFLGEASAVEDSIHAYLPVDMTARETIVATGESGTVAVDDIVFADIWRFTVKTGRGGEGDTGPRFGTIDCAYILNGTPEEEGKLRDGATISLKLYHSNGAKSLSGEATISSVRSVEGWRHDGFWKSQFDFVCTGDLLEEDVSASDWHLNKPSPSHVE